MSKGKRCTWCQERGHTEANCEMAARGERPTFAEYIPPTFPGELPKICVALSPQHERDRERVR